MAHIFLIDPLEKLNPKKDSSLYLAESLKTLGVQVYLLFESEMAFSNIAPHIAHVYEFKSQKSPQSFYLNELQLAEKISHTWAKGDTLHFRLDPPFDARYLRFLWIADALTELGVKVINNPKGVAAHSEKLLAYRHSHSHPSFVGASLGEATHFINQLKKRGCRELILKPLDLYQGYGVTKVGIDDDGPDSWRVVFSQMVEIHKGPIVVQPFVASVTDGEIRSTFWRGRELASILKIPPQGSYLANIAQGAHFQQHKLSELQHRECTEVSLQLLKWGVEWVAFDLLGGCLSEVNITCPGLLVECATASKEDLALIMAKDLLAD